MSTGEVVLIHTELERDRNKIGFHNMKFFSLQLKLYLYFGIILFLVPIQVQLNLVCDYPIFNETFGSLEIVVVLTKSLTF